MNFTTMQDLEMSDTLASLDDAQLDFLETGLIHNFGATFEGERPELLLVLECGQRVALDVRTVTVGDVWGVASCT